MAHNDLHLIYFSPTGTTEKVMDAIAQGLNPAKMTRHDLTKAKEEQELCLDNGMAIIGIPVYAGRVPETCLQRLSGFSAQNIPTVLVALYGNRKFEDALVELRDVVTAKGFSVVAAGAFVGEHSYATPDYPVAVGRPDKGDLKLAQEFGQQVAAKLTNGPVSTPHISGNVPYKERVTFGGVAPETDATGCHLCGECAGACPVDVISVDEAVITDAGHCIMCAACVRACPTKARTFDHPVVNHRRGLLVKNCSQPKAPTLFI